MRAMSNFWLEGRLSSCLYIYFNYVRKRVKPMLVKHGTPLNCVYCYLVFVEKKRIKEKNAQKEKKKKIY